MSESSWRTKSPEVGQPDWTAVWASGGPMNLQIEEAHMSGPQGGYTLHRVMHGQRIGAGAVAVGVLRENGSASVLMVLQDRVRPGVQLWELPRGVADPDDEDLVATAMRELEEETGVHGESGRLLGQIYPDSGLLGAGVGVVLIDIDGRQTPHPADGESRAAEWVGTERLSELVALGLLRDGLSLSALMLAGVWSGTDLRL